VQLKVNGSAFGIRLGYYPQSVLNMPDAPALRECIHNGLLIGKGIDKLKNPISILAISGRSLGQGYHGTT
jgi:hypothetical protein